MSGLRSRRKGQRAQCEVANILRTANYDVENIGLMYKVGPDLSIRPPIYDIGSPPLTAEVKRRAAGYGTLYKHLANNWALFARDDGKKWLIVQTLDQWIKDRQS
jgi:hypothetical protein